MWCTGKAMGEDIHAQVRETICLRSGRGSGDVVWDGAEACAGSGGSVRSVNPGHPIDRGG